jgi:hypothetical protein
MANDAAKMADSLLKGTDTPAADSGKAAPADTTKK